MAAANGATGRRGTGHGGALLAKQAWKSKRDVARRAHERRSTAQQPLHLCPGRRLDRRRQCAGPAIAPLAKATRRPGADADLGGFGGFFDLKAAGFTDPLLVAANDGVGTKLKLAIDSGPA